MGAVSSREQSYCPDCRQETVHKKWTWRGILSAIFCFPCGLWCCLCRETKMQCDKCHCDVIRSNMPETGSNSHGYKFKMSNERTQLSPSLVAHYRSVAISNASETSINTVTTDNSEAVLVRSQDA